jgi:hypothetical protein
VWGQKTDHQAKSFPASIGHLLALAYPQSIDRASRRWILGGVKTLFTSFGRNFLYSDEMPDSAGIFYEMPPIVMPAGDTPFLPDPTSFILSEAVLMDGQSYERLTTMAHPLYSTVAAFFKEARAAQLIELVDFETTLRPHISRLDEMLVQDLQHPQWSRVLLESTVIWSKLTQHASPPLQNSFSISHLRDSIPVRCEPDHVNVHLARMADGASQDFSHLWSIVDKYQEAGATNNSAQWLVDRVTRYLAYTNANMLLAQEHRAGIYDWADFTPFYREKVSPALNGIGQPQELNRAPLQALFEFFAPSVIFDSPKDLIKLLRDKRIEDLRRICARAAEGKVFFDQEYALRTMMEVFKIERRISALKSKISWLTLPLSFAGHLSHILHKPLEEAMSHTVENELRKPFNWFFLIRDFVESRDR